MKKNYKLIDKKVTFKDFFKQAIIHPNAGMIKGVVCGYRIEDIEDEFECTNNVDAWKSLLTNWQKAVKWRRFYEHNKDSEKS